MRQDVVIRGTTKTGLVILLPDELDFPTVLGRLQKKLVQGGRFFEGAEVTVKVGTRSLSEADEAAIISIAEAAQMSVRGISQGGDAPVETQVRQPQPLSVPEPEMALVVNRTLRSGQSVRHQGDVIILGDVNPGAEVVASGHIVVMGALRGVAHAGCTGNIAALVAASKLRPTQLRIAHVIGRAPDDQGDLQTLPEVARLQDGMIVVETPTEPKRQA